jgi:HAE1 family hydrophobic/amphiphilic exporter-1
VAPQPLDVLTMLGFLMLVGIVVKNPILLVDRVLTSLRTRGMSLDAAIIDAVQFRARPIFMTTLTTVFGLIPLVLFPGEGSELYRGLGSAVLGGLILSTFVTLIYVPALFWLVQEGLGLFRRSKPAEGQRPAPELARSEGYGGGGGGGGL